MVKAFVKETLKNCVFSNLGLYAENMVNLITRMVLNEFVWSHCGE